MVSSDSSLVVELAGIVLRVVDVLACTVLFVPVGAVLVVLLSVRLSCTSLLLTLTTSLHLHIIHNLNIIFHRNKIHFLYFTIPRHIYINTVNDNI